MGTIFQTALYRRRVQRAVRRSSDDAPYLGLLRAAAAEVAQNIACLTRPPASVMVVGGWERLVKLPAGIDRKVWADDDPLSASASECVVSFFCDHHTDAIAERLLQYRAALTLPIPAGAAPRMLFGCLPGAGTAPELMPLAIALDDARGGVSPRFSPLPTKQAIGQLLNAAGMREIVVSSTHYTLEFRSLAQALQDVRAIGESNCLVARKKTMTGRTFFHALDQQVRTATSYFHSGRGVFALPVEVINFHALAPPLDFPPSLD